MKPNFLVIGAQKSGSTFVQDCLAEHPEVFLVPGEIPFFEDPDYLNSSLKDFERLFSKVRTEKAIGIKRPNYFTKFEVPERIHKHYPSAKLILVLRNPIERAISAYFHNINYGFIPVEDVNQGMMKVINLEYQNKYKRAQEIIDFGFYYKHLIHYLNYFDLNQIHIVLFDDIKKNSIEMIKNIYHYLEIQSDYIPKCLNSRPQAVTYSLPRLKLLTLRNSFMYTYNEDQTRLSSKNGNYIDIIVAGLITVFDKSIASRFFHNEKPKLTTELKQKLIEIYEDDIESLSKFLGRSLEGWKQ